MTSSKPNHLPKAPSPNAITLEVKASVYKFGGDTNIHSIAVAMLVFQGCILHPESMHFTGN